MKRKLWGKGGIQIMGATNQIKGTNISLRLAGLTCPQCQQKFTQPEINESNFDLWFDTTNEVKLTPLAELTQDAYYKPFGRTGYELTIWIRSIEHEDCPRTELCQGCYGRFLTESMEIKGKLYCSNCAKEVDHE